MAIKDITEFPILNEVHSILTERQAMYGASEDSFQLIADFWNTYLVRVCGITTLVTKKDVAMLMALMKVAREMNQHKHDNLADIIGYMAHADKITRTEEEFTTAFNEACDKEGFDPHYDEDPDLTSAFNRSMDDWLNALSYVKAMSGFDNDGGKGGAPAMVGYPPRTVLYGIRH
jgi:hypothetical protein